MIFKVLVLGRNQGLKNGFLSLASGDCISCQLQPSLGVSLGVTRTQLDNGPDVALQLWSIPDSERFAKLMNSFSRGHRGAVVVLEEGDVSHLTRLLTPLPLETIQSTVFLLLMENVENETMDSLADVIGITPEVKECSTVSEIIDILSYHLSGVRKMSSRFPLAVKLPMDACPPVIPDSREIEREPSTSEEIDEIRDICIGMRLNVNEWDCQIDLPEGTFTVGFTEGTVDFKPVLCEMCIETCKKDVSICIVGQDSGWSSGTLQRRALLTVAKIIGLAKRELPEHVEMQINRAAVCSNFLPTPDISEELITRTVHGFREFKPRATRIPLLQLAQQRVAEGRLSTQDYNTLKRRLEQLSEATE